MKQLDPMSILGLGIVMGGPGAIEFCEAQGQRDLVAASKGSNAQLPTDIHDDSKKTLERAGVKFLGVVENDPIFQKVELPTGWKINRTDHSMWTNLCDEKGRKRASIFYKAALYDRSANIHALSRFKIDAYFNKDHEAVAVARVNDQDIYPFESQRFDIKTDEDRYGILDRKTHTYTTPSKRDLARSQCEAWLNEHYPDWEDPSAYWD